MGNILPDTLRKFKSYFGTLDSPFVLHYYCSLCFSLVEEHANTCSNPACLKELSSRHSKAYFIEIPSIQQLQTFFSRDGFYNSVQHRFHWKKKHQNNLEDICDGALYRELSEYYRLLITFHFWWTLTVFRYLSRWMCQSGHYTLS